MPIEITSAKQSHSRGQSELETGRQTVEEKQTGRYAFEVGIWKYSVLWKIQKTEKKIFRSLDVKQNVFFKTNFTVGFSRFTYV